MGSNSNFDHNSTPAAPSTQSDPATPAQGRPEEIPEFSKRAWLSLTISKDLQTWLDEVARKKNWDRAKVARDILERAKQKSKRRK